MSGAGWDSLHVCVDDHSRLAFSQLYPNRTASSATAFLTAAVDYYRRLGISVRRVLTDNGKAERFIQTELHERACAHTYNTSTQRAQYLTP